MIASIIKLYVNLYSKTLRLGSIPQERELGRSTHNGSDGFFPGDIISGGISNSTLTRRGLIRNNQLPGAVEEARRRLSERLRSISLTETSANSNQETHTRGTNSRTNLNILYGESTLHTHRPSLFHIENKKIPALRWDAYYAMKGESCRVTECCICLEEFKDEDRLVKLLCSHKFHHACLKLWVRSSGDCPLCRADII
ncbi:hypothetical protein KSP39_PZI000244 [Platanthera zijinensis]|uniref:RING-type domain-containing protein n=1 Tax=Platanthera zijinensis TaxID=2320716 RepID=A0AAP0C114_9ASPA